MIWGESAAPSCSRFVRNPKPGGSGLDPPEKDNTEKWPGWRFDR